MSGAEISRRTVLSVSGAAALAGAAGASTTSGPRYPGTGVRASDDALVERVRRISVSFEVASPSDPSLPTTVRGSLYLPAGKAASSCPGVQLVIHGFSYGEWVWDLPGRPSYSYARGLAAAGYPVVTLDLPGYGKSDRPNGRSLSNEAYGAMAHEIVTQLRRGTYNGSVSPSFSKIVIAGHSIDGAIATFEAGTFGDVDALIPMAISDEVSREARENYQKYIVPQTAASGYVYWWTPQIRNELFYQADMADPEVIADDERLAELVPSGQAQSIFARGDQKVMGKIRVPVLLVFAERDEITPVSSADDEANKFTASPDVSVRIVPDAGHTFVLHRNRQVAYDTIIQWLKNRPEVAPTCG